MSPNPTQKVEHVLRINTDLLKLLVAEGLAGEQEMQAAQTVAQRRRMYVEEILVQMDIVKEADLLKIQASFYKTQFISTQKLASAPIDKALLRMVPQKLAERFCIFPILYDPKKSSLKILTVQPDDPELLQNVQFAARVHEVQPLVARPAAIQAAIEKHYAGNANAFFDIRDPDASHQQAETQEQLMRQYDQRLVRESALSVPPPQKGAMEALREALERPPAKFRTETGKPPPVPPGVTVKREAPDSAPPSAVEQIRASLRPMAMERKDSRAPGTKPAAPGMTMHDYLETLNVFVALLESEREELRGHSSLVARIARRVCERLGLPTDEADSIVMAAYLHDVGKATLYHLTALNVAESESHQARARKTYLMPVRMFESVRLPAATVRALTHIYERFDGNGFPDRLAGKEIDLGARLIAIVETHADLTSHARNPFRKKLTPQESCEVLIKYKNTIFDPVLVDVFKSTVLGEDLRAKLLAGSKRALLADPDREETMVLELRLVDQGYDVTVARTSKEVENLMKSNEFDVIISEVDLQPQDGFELLKNIRAGSGAEIPFIFVTKESGGEMAHKGFELGADDYITKPASPDLVVLKIRQVLEGSKRTQKSRGVSGSLEEMSLPDVVQILFHSRKSGKLLITSGQKRGEVLFSDGHIFNASYGGKQREEAFYEMLSLTSGHFELDPEFKPTEKLIDMNPESLLLEGMRRLDESNR